MVKDDMRAWAVKGAEQRLIAMSEEAKLIFATFPELRAQGRGFSLVSQEAGATATSRRTPSGRSSVRKRTMSAEARKRIGDAQRRRWAAFKASNDNADQSPMLTARPKSGASRKKR
jgi:hypothetical protein